MMRIGFEGHEARRVQVVDNARHVLAVGAEVARDKDVLRTPMKVETLPMKVEQLTWQFLDMTDEGGRMAIMWDTTMGSVAFTVGR
jgi:hypothetical protein